MVGTRGKRQGLGSTWWSRGGKDKDREVQGMSIHTRQESKDREVYKVSTPGKKARTAKYKVSTSSKKARTVMYKMSTTGKKARKAKHKVSMRGKKAKTAKYKVSTRPVEGISAVAMR